MQINSRKLAAGLAATLGLAAGGAVPANATIDVGPTVKVVVTTADLRLALSPQPSLTFTTVRPRGVPIVTVHDTVTYQRFKGVGGAMTDSSAWLIQDGLSPSQRALVTQALFGQAGIRLNFLRIPIAATDFTARERPYSYDDLPAHAQDPALLHFSIAHDEPYVLPAIREALALNPGAFVVATPWSAPGWMKTNDALDNRGHSGWLRPSSYGPLARYIVKFLLAYARAGVRVDAITPQNEPGNPALYPGMGLSEQGEATLVSTDLIPDLRRAGLATKVYGYDWGWSASSIGYARALARAAVAHELTGLASHCYFGSPAVITGLHALAPALDEIESECSPGIMPYSTSELEISSLRNWASAVALWNLALDPKGGPVEPPNSGCPHCSGILTIDPQRHTVAFTPSYYQLGQVSKFVDPGAVRLASNHLVRYSYPGRNRNIASSGLDDVAFRNPDGTEVLVAYDNSSEPIEFALRSNHHYVTYRLAPGETATLSWPVTRVGPAG